MLLKKAEEIQTVPGGLPSRLEGPAAPLTAMDTTDMDFEDAFQKFLTAPKFIASTVCTLTRPKFFKVSGFTFRRLIFA